jgi:uncharacterized repeat protein (TIGR02543 family)
VRQVNSPDTTVGALPTSPARTGYTFTGWNTQEDGGGTAFTASTPVTANITVYAHWSVSGPDSGDISLRCTDQGAGAFNQDTFVVRKSGSPASKTISLTGSWISNTWLIDGESRGTGTSFTVNAAHYTPGGHTLQALVYDGVKYWSRTIQFTVSN